MAWLHDNLGPGNEEPEFYGKNTVLANDCQEGPWRTEPGFHDALS